MKTSNQTWGDGLCPAANGQNQVGKFWMTVCIGPAARRTWCLAAGLMLSAAAASGQPIYAIEFNHSQNQFGTVNLLDGTFTPVGNEGATLFNDIAAAADGTIYGIVNTSSLVTFNTANGGILTSVSFNVGGIESLAIAPNGTIYGASQSALYTINPVSGLATLVGNFNNSLLNNSGQNIRFAADGNLYDTDGGVNAFNTDLFQISLANGYASMVGVITNFPGLCLENAGQDMYGVGIQLGAASTPAQDLIGIDLCSTEPGGTNLDGSLTVLHYVMVTTNFPNNYNFSGAGNFVVPGTPLTPAPAPEPGVCAAFVAGGVLLVAMNRRRRC